MNMRIRLGGIKAETRLDADLSEQKLLLLDEMAQRLRDRKHRLKLSEYLRKEVQ